MKKFILIILLMLTFEASSFAAWFCHQDHYYEEELQAQLQDQQQHNSDLTGVIIALGIGCVVTLVIGTMIGSKTRRASNDK